ncbi:MAG: class I SAM-dependent methyltransferase family protein [Candidatus Bathyarchaeia archaeon]
MPKESLCLKVPKIHGEKAIKLVNALKVTDRELEIKRDSDFIYIPITRQPQENELETLKKHLPTFEISKHLFPEKKRAKTFIELLEDRLPPYLLASLPRAMEFVGDIAVVEIPPELDAHKDIIGKAVLEAHKNVKTVLAKAGAVGGVHRVREFNVIAGEPKTTTIHKEYGCQYYVDLAKAYFSARLAYEHKRVASLVRDGETVIDMFAGVGPFSILIARTHERVKVYAIDVNSYAVELLRNNIKLNRVEDKVRPLLGDARQIIEERLVGVADRVIMNLPEKAIEFADVACKALKPEGGVVHFYSFVDANNSLESVKLRFIETVEKSGRRVEKILFSRFVRETAPYEWQVVLDALVH